MLTKLALLQIPILFVYSIIGSQIQENGTNTILISQSGIRVSAGIVAQNFLQSIDYAAFPGLLTAVTSESITNAVGTTITNWNYLGVAFTNLYTNVTGFPPTVQLSSVNGRKGVWFDQTNKMGCPVTSEMNSNCTIFIAGTFTNMDQNIRRYILSGPSNGGIMNEFDNASGKYFFVWVNANDVNMDSFPLVSGESRGETRFFRFETANDYTKSIQIGFNQSIQPCTWSGASINWAGNGWLALGSLSGVSDRGWVGLIQEVVIYTNALNMADCLTINNYLCKKYQVVPKGYLTCDGDQTLIGGAMSPTSKQYAPAYNQLIKYAGSNIVAGALASTLRSIASIQTHTTNTSSGALAVGFHPTSCDSVYLLCFGSAQISLGNYTASTLFPILSNCMACARANNWIVPAITLPPGCLTNDVERLSYNSMVRQWWPTFADCLIDLNTLPFTQPTDVTNSTYYVNDGGTIYCPTEIQSQVFARYIMQKLKPLVSTHFTEK